ncbi:hypothetical protein A3L11_03670 [Thermococcus siculi]|uniref:Glycosyltransferase 2-like domain-containing protein n=1 Tax=Thermococcus siculi TaxID=72803 RepID=A0A2Z2MKP8_9EURY|nr:glycosyltransferase [Thermococcus siculi]ASJ08378.1 hypothetical protein A3L11_03670 [Thermococcus siculi]
MERVKVSVIIPTRNRIEYLQRVLESLENQTVVPDEVIIVGDQDDVQTQEFIKNLLLEDLKYRVNFILTKNEGTAKKRNTGFEYSRGEVLVFLEDDVVLEEKYIENAIDLILNHGLDIVSGYTFDIVDLNSIYWLKWGDYVYILKNLDKKFINEIINELKNKYRERILLLGPTRKILLGQLLRKIKNFIKSLFLWESWRKGKILPSGYRSEYPDITKIEKNNRLYEVEWVQGGNFICKRKVFREFKFDENLEKFSKYALNEDLEWSARVIKKYKIYLSSKLKLMHLRAPSVRRLSSEQRLKALVISTHHIASINGNYIAHLWATTGLVLSRIPVLLISPKDGIKQIKVIIKALKDVYIVKLKIRNKEK